MRQFQYAFSDIHVASSISSISVDALVSRHVLSGISDTQRCESDLLIELKYLLAIESAVRFFLIFTLLLLLSYFLYFCVLCSLIRAE